MVYIEDDKKKKIPGWDAARKEERNNQALKNSNNSKTGGIKRLWLFGSFESQQTLLIKTGLITHLNIFPRSLNGRGWRLLSQNKNIFFYLQIQKAKEHIIV